MEHVLQRGKWKGTIIWIVVDLLIIAFWFHFIQFIAFLFTMSNLSLMYFPLRSVWSSCHLHRCSANDALDRWSTTVSEGALFPNCQILFALFYRLWLNFNCLIMLNAIPFSTFLFKSTRIILPLCLLNLEIRTANVRIHPWNGTSLAFPFTLISRLSRQIILYKSWNSYSRILIANYYKLRAL